MFRETLDSNEKSSLNRDMFCLLKKKYIINSLDRCVYTVSMMCIPKYEKPFIRTKIIASTEVSHYTLKITSYSVTKISTQKDSFRVGDILLLAKKV